MNEKQHPFTALFQHAMHIWSADDRLLNAERKDQRKELFRQSSSLPHLPHKAVLNQS